MSESDYQSGHRRRRGWNKSKPVVIAGSNKTTYPQGDARRLHNTYNTQLKRTSSEVSAPETTFHSSGAVFSYKKNCNEKEQYPTSVKLEGADVKLSTEGPMSKPQQFSYMNYLDDRHPSIWLPCLYIRAYGAIKWNISEAKGYLSEDGSCIFPTLSNQEVRAVFSVHNGAVYIGPATEHIWAAAVITKKNDRTDIAEDALMNTQHWKVSYVNLQTNSVSWTTEEEDILYNVYVWPFFTLINGTLSEQTMWAIPKDTMVWKEIFDAWGGVISISSPPHFCGQLDGLDISTSLLTCVSLRNYATVKSTKDAAKLDPLVSETQKELSGSAKSVTNESLLFRTNKELYKSDQIQYVSQISNTSDQSLILIPGFISTAFSRLIHFCNSFVLEEKKDMKPSKIDSWEEALSVHIAILAEAISILEPADKSGLVGSAGTVTLPLPPFYHLRQPVTVNNIASSRKKDKMCLSRWKQCCSTGVKQQWCISTSLTLVLCGRSRWDSRSLDGVLTALKDILILKFPFGTEMYSCRLKIGSILNALILELLSVYSKRNSPEQKSYSNLVKSFFSSPESMSCNDTAAEGSILYPSISFNYEYLETHSDHTGPALIRILAWKQAVAKLLHRLTRNATFMNEPSPKELSTSEEQLDFEATGLLVTTLKFMNSILLVRFSIWCSSLPVSQKCFLHEKVSNTFFLIEDQEDTAADKNSHIAEVAPQKPRHSSIKRIPRAVNKQTKAEVLYTKSPESSVERGKKQAGCKQLLCHECGFLLAVDLLASVAKYYFKSTSGTLIYDDAVEAWCDMCCILVAHLHY